MQGKVLLVDDDELIRHSTEQWLSMAGFDVIMCETAEQVLPHLSKTFPGVLISDVKMPGMDGLELLAYAQACDPELPVILITGHGDVDMALSAMRNGAYDFIEKPFVPERLVENINRACEKRRLTIENLRLQENLASQSGIDAKLIGISPAIQRLKRDILKYAVLDTNVIIYGETGTGKELVAQCLHEYSGRRCSGFVPLNCGAVPENLIESELFGHQAGAFTGANKRRIGKFEYADKGTLFLDEIESMSPALQVKILRTLQEGLVEPVGSNRPVAVDLRVVAASKTDLRTEEGFREDLFYRLNVSALRLPPLREREEDIPLLFEHYARQAARQHDCELRRFTQQDIDNMQGYSWPGNVRELKNAAVRYALDGALSLADILFAQDEFVAGCEEAAGLSLGAQVANFESQIIRQALTAHKGNIAAVMEQLDLPRRTLNQKMVKYDINRGDYT